MKKGITVLAITGLLMSAVTQAGTPKEDLMFRLARIFKALEYGGKTKAGQPCEIHVSPNQSIGGNPWYGVMLDGRDPMPNRWGTYNGVWRSAGFFQANLSDKISVVSMSVTDNSLTAKTFVDRDIMGPSVDLASDWSGEMTVTAYADTKELSSVTLKELSNKYDTNERITREFYCGNLYPKGWNLGN